MWVRFKWDFCWIPVEKKKALRLGKRIGWDVCSMDRGILWWLWQAFLLFSDVLRQLYSCLMLSPHGKEALHIHQARRVPAPFQVSLNTLSRPGRRPDVSQSWTGSSQRCFPSFGRARVCQRKALLSNLLWGVMFVYRACLSSRSFWEETEQRMEIVDVFASPHKRLLARYEKGTQIQFVCT